MAPRLFRERINAELVQVLARCPPERMEIVTFGFLPVVSAMLPGSPWENCRLNATTARLLLRQDWSKLSRARRFRSDAELAGASLVTDSVEDADLLGAVTNGCLIAPAGPTVPARHKLYFPLRYTAVAKYSAAYLRDQTLFVDLPVIAFAFVLGGRRGLADMAAALFLYFSLMCIYEIGYFENDQNKATRETRPRVTAISAHFRDFPLARHAWVWAVVLGIAGIALEAGFDPKSATLHFVAWLAILISLRGWFYLYNKRGSRFRVLTYPVLQAFKYAWPLAFAAFSPLAGAIMAAQVITMWAVYLVYRHGGDGDSVPRDAVRIGLVLLIAALAGGSEVLQENPLILALVGGWLVWRVIPKRRIAKGLLGILRGRQSRLA